MSRKAKQSRRLTIAGLIAVSAATLLMMAWAMFPSAALANGTITWEPQRLGSDNLPCEFGGHWIFTPGGQNTVTAATLTVNGATYPMSQSGQGAWSADSVGPITIASTASVSYTGNAGVHANLTLSHCAEGTTTTTTKTTTTHTTTTHTTTTTTTTPTTTTTTPTKTTTTHTTTTTTPTYTTTTTQTPTVSPTSITSTTTKTKTPVVAPTTVRPGGTAFTGVEDVVPLGAIALTLLTGGSGLLWAGSRRRREADEGDE